VPKDAAYDGLYDQLDKIVAKARRDGELRKIMNQYFEITVRAK
jgi:ABC-type amino acid transport substrate-binding protein